MIIMPIKEGENIERALKKFKRKYEKTGVLKELRRRQYFTKPSVVNVSTSCTRFTSSSCSAKKSSLPSNCKVPKPRFAGHDTGLKRGSL